MKQPLLSPQEVAKYLNLSVKSVYAHAHELGGFFPAGIKLLRFRPEVIDGIMAGKEGMAVSVPASRDQAQLETPPDKRRGRRRNGGSEKIIEFNGWKTDPSRHGL